MATSETGPRIFYPGCRAILQVDLESFGNDDGIDTIKVPILPKRATVHRNSYRIADSYELTFEAGDLPFDPRIIRAGSAEIYLFQSPNLATQPKSLSRADPLADLDAGATNPRSPTQTLGFDVGTIPASQFKKTYTPVIAGLFDEADLELSDDGKWVTISGQDYTAFLASIQWKPDANGVARRIPTGKRVDLIVQDLLEEADPLGKLSVRVDDGLTTDKLPIVTAAQTSGSKRGIPIEQNTSYWDVIYKLVLRCGLIAFVEALDVVIADPKQRALAHAKTPKRLAWGKNLEHLRLERKLGKVQSPTILVQSYDPITKQPISIEYPDGTLSEQRPLKPTGATHKGQHTTEKFKAKAQTRGKQVTTLRKRDEYEIIPAGDITDRALLLQMAKTAYFLRGRGERKVVAKTRDLKDAGMPESDMLNLVAGDAVLIYFDEFDHELMTDPQTTTEAKVQQLVLRGFNRAVAELVAKRYTSLIALDRPFQVKEATYDFDADSGIDIELEIQDFMVIDGLRDGTGATPTPSVERTRSGNVTSNGQQLGQSAQQRAANARRFP